MDGWIGWCVVVWGESMCFGGRSRRGLPSDRREWWLLLLFRFVGHRVLISSDLCAGGWLGAGLYGFGGRSRRGKREWMFLLELNDFCGFLVRLLQGCFERGI